MQRLTWPQAIGWRMRQHRLHQRAPRRDLLKIATEHGGLHAQVMSSAELIAWNRVEGLAEGDLARLTWQDRQFVKTWAMRHTLHLIAARDYSTWIAAASSLSHYVIPTWLRRLNFTDDEFRNMIEATATALCQGPMLRADLADEVARLTGIPRLREHMEMSWGIMLKPPAMTGHLCFAEGDGQRSRFMHPADHIKPTKALPRPLETLALQFFETCGPATTKELSRWLMLDAATTRALIPRLPLEPVEVAGQLNYLSARHLSDARNATPDNTVRLLPSFDPYVFAAGLTPDAYIKGGHYKQIYKASAWYAPVICEAGQFIGTWEMKRSPKSLNITLTPFRPITAKRKKAIAAESEKLAQHMNRPINLRWK